MAIEDSDYLDVDTSDAMDMENLLAGNKMDRDTAEDAENSNPLTDL